MVNQQFAFAVHILTALAFAGAIVDSRTLATSINTNPVVVRRLLAALRRAGLVKTFGGKKGGAHLRKSPQIISLLDVYKAVEPRPLIAINRRTPWKHCPVSCQMKNLMEGVSQGAEQAVRKELGRITLQDLLREIKTSSSNSSQRALRKKTARHFRRR